LNAPRVLLVSNGAGEDAIAREVACRAQGLELEALPLVGQGVAYEGVARRVGPRRSMPSGGLIPEALGNLLRDLVGGLAGLVLQQIAWLRRERRNYRLFVAVGDLWPVVLAGLAGARPLVFIGTAKSDYHHRYSALEALVLRFFTVLALVRDEPTAQSLRERRVRAAWVGNAMMDGLEVTGAELGVAAEEVCLALLPGSREGTYSALPRMLEAYTILAGQMDSAPRALVGLAPSVDLERLGGSCPGWTMVSTGRERGAVAELRGPAPPVMLVRKAFPDVLHRSTVAFGLAGTAHEQAAGLGLPVVAFEPGAESRLGWYRGRQKGLLGEALRVVEDDPVEVAAELRRLLEDSAERARRGQVGRERLGPPGGGRAMAGILERLARGETLQAGDLAPPK
jgi:uncharacterized protein (TIGR03492 family)